MKRIKYIIAVNTIFMLLSLTSCMSYTDSHEKTEAAELIFKETASTIKEYAKCVDLAQRVNLYLQSEEDERENILSSLLAGYEISEVNNTILVAGNDLIWEIHRNSTNSLATPSTKWSIESKDNSALIFPKNSFHITTQSINRWNIEITNAYNQVSQTTGSVALKMQMILDDEQSNSPITNNYAINMMEENTSGRINSSDGIFYSTYKITKPLIADLDDFIAEEGSYYEEVIIGGRFLEGWLEMEAVRTVENKVDFISTKIISDGYSVDLYFYGITESLRFKWIGWY